MNFPNQVVHCWLFQKYTLSLGQQQFFFVFLWQECVIWFDGVNFEMTTNFNQLELMLKFSSPQSCDTFSEMRWLEMARRRCRYIKKKRGFILLMSPLANDLKINFGRSFNAIFMRLPILYLTSCVFWVCFCVCIWFIFFWCLRLFYANYEFLNYIHERYDFKVKNFHTVFL